MKLSAKEKTAFGLGAVGKDMVYMLSASYILYYYQDVLGVSAMAMGIILMAARVFDAFNDPIMGVIVAKTRTRWGKFRPWLLVGTLCNAIVLYLMFAAPPAWIWKRDCGICSHYLYCVGSYLYHDGHSFLVDDSGIYRRRKRARKFNNYGAFLFGCRFRSRYDYYDEMCVYAGTGK